MKYKWDDIKIGDTVLTKNGLSGKIIMLRSYAYLNDSIIRNISDISTILIDFMPFQYDNVKHKGIDYPTITIAAEIMEYGRTSYYIIDIDLKDIKEIKNSQESIQNNQVKNIKKNFNKYINKIKKILISHD
ncbi:MAG: hypothetical protein [Wendovervirus sonii]|uniref:Uncharacterized protein n=1 Tax=phage Lak_Megaphage_Sonny TaxID=3109229 RepID=A0ABZ0Z2Q5_9CAUD|nr:MAG: hypothetical protein [phage Lak_Megaphage_Sonny]